MHLPFDFNVQPFISYLHIHPHIAEIFTFFVVFLEAMAVIGVIVPGSITMTAIGTLIGANIIPAGSVLAWAIAGAILGDFLSYWLGVYFQDRLHRVWPFSKHPELLQKSEVFFAKHGGKSVFIGRFIGPMRAMVPMVAGMLKMPLVKFTMAAIPSAAIWAVIYMLPGIILGALSLELPPKVATQFILVSFALIVLVWGITWVMQHFAKRFYRWLDRYVMQLWLFMQTHKPLRWTTELLADPREPENHQQLSLLFLAIIVAVAFLAAFTNVAHHGILTIFNNAIYNLLLSLRTDLLDHFAVAITSLGEYKVLIGASILLLAWLVYKRYWYVALHWFVLILLSAGAIFEIKSFFFSPRPGGTLNFQHDSSFPSGHTALSLALMGFWSVIVARELKLPRRWIPYACTSVIVAAIILSRLYLGAHWLTDVFGSVLLALCLVLVLTISYRRRHGTRFSLSGFVIISISALLVTWSGFSIYKYTQRLQDYALHWPSVTIDKQDWPKEIGKNIPLYRLNRLGVPIQAFNVEWLGSLDDVERILLQHGWEKQPVALDLHGVALRLVGDPSVSHLSLFPQLYHNRPMALLMTKETDQDNKALVLRLWQSDITINDYNLPLWLGVAEYHYAEPKLIRLPHHNNKKYPKFIGAVDELSGYIENFKWQKIVITPEQQPKEMQDLHWNGMMFLIQPK